MGVESREALTALHHRYAEAIDTGAHDLLDEVFTSDARIDYRPTGGIEGSYAEIRAFLAEEMARYRVLQHFISNVRIEADGDGFAGRAYVLAVHGYKTETGMRFFDLGGEYADRLVRTPAGLRIAARVLRLRFVRGELPG